MPFEDQASGVEAFDADGKPLGKVGGEWLEGVRSVQIGRPAEGCRLLFDEPQAVGRPFGRPPYGGSASASSPAGEPAAASLWIRLVDGPTKVGGVKALTYSIQM